MILSEEEEGKARKKEYNKDYHSRPESKIKRRSRELKPEFKMKVKERGDNLRFEILSTYSKRQSTSDIPCCACCGLNSHIEVLSLDHIAGRQEMDSEPELVKIGYSSKIVGISLHRWNKKNNFPNGFQVLCMNCNFAKGMKYNNNKCPLEGKPH